jgi:predicted transcriptional regulator
MSIRLSKEEREAVNTLAKKVGVPPSYLARHFLMQAVSYQTAQLSKSGGSDAAAE